MKDTGIKERLLYAFFPRRCKYCGTVILPDEELCEDCRKSLPRVEKPVCFKCGCSKEDCHCKQKSSFYERICAPFYYSGPIERAVGRMKFGLKQYLCKMYGEDMADCVNEKFENAEYDIICYIPFSKRDGKKRQFNQSRELAKAVGEKLSVPVCDALEKIYDTDVQHTLGNVRRNGNVFGAYSVNDENAVEGKRILLVDDIKTTGATLGECAKMLKIYGAESVDCVVFALGKGKQKIDSKG